MTTTVDDHAKRFFPRAASKSPVAIELRIADSKRLAWAQRQITKLEYRRNGVTAAIERHKTFLRLLDEFDAQSTPEPS